METSANYILVGFFTRAAAYDLQPAVGAKRGGRKSRMLVFARPQASAALTTDRIMIEPYAASITYLPDARWSDEVPVLLQTLLIRSISETGRVVYVGRSDTGLCRTKPC
jgi:cholesterol transport system auxiliary component